MSLSNSYFRKKGHHRFWQGLTYAFGYNFGRISKGIIYLVPVKSFPKNLHFLPPDTYTYVRVSGGKKCQKVLRTY